MTSYIGIVLYLLNIFGWKVWHRTKKVDPKEMDLATGRLEDDGCEYPGTLTKAYRKVATLARGKRN